MFPIHFTHSETPWQATSNSFNDVVLLQGANCTFPIAIWAKRVVGRTAAFRVLFRVMAGVDRIWSSCQCRNGSADDKTWRTVCGKCHGFFFGKFTLKMDDIPKISLKLDMGMPPYTTMNSDLQLPISE